MGRMVLPGKLGGASLGEICSGTPKLKCSVKIVDMKLDFREVAFVYHIFLFINIQK